MLVVFKMTEWRVLGLHFAKILRAARLDMTFMYPVFSHITCICTCTQRHGTQATMVLATSFASPKLLPRPKFHYTFVAFWYVAIMAKMIHSEHSVIQYFGFQHHSALHVSMQNVFPRNNVTLEPSCKEYKLVYLVLEYSAVQFSTSTHLWLKF